MSSEHDTERTDAFASLFEQDPYTFTDPMSGIDPSFVFDFQSYDELGDGQRWSTWMSVEPLQRGPEHRPAWVVTSQGAVDTELGILKSGKEADVFLVERVDPLEPENGVGMAAKR
jgi:RIO kinase 1